MLDEGTVHLGRELQKSLQTLDQAVDIWVCKQQPRLDRN